MGQFYFSNSKDDKATLADKLIMLAILVNCVVIFLQESGVNTTFVQLVDAICIVIFFLEMFIKIKQFGFKDYWSVGMNRFDAILVILSLPGKPALA